MAAAAAWDVHGTEGHKPGGLEGDPVVVAGRGSCLLRNGITRDATRSGSSSITQ